MSKYFPFSAIVGQEEMKAALLIAAVDPRIGGVMVFGDRGTGRCPGREREGQERGEQAQPPTVLPDPAPWVCAHGRHPFRLDHEFLRRGRA